MSGLSNERERKSRKFVGFSSLLSPALRGMVGADRNRDRKQSAVETAAAVYHAARRETPTVKRVTVRITTVRRMTMVVPPPRGAAPPPGPPVVDDPGLLLSERATPERPTPEEKQP
jgi:hypothetical protein